MSTSIKRLLTGVAIAGATTSFVYFSLVNAAGEGFEGAEVSNYTISSSTGSITVTGVQLSGSDYNFSNTGLDYMRVYSGSNELVSGISLSNSGTNFFTVTGLNTSALSNDLNYRVAFGTVDGDGAAVLSKGGADEVTVNARVEPVLRMALSTGALDFGTLQTSTTNKVTMSGEVATNAVDGLSVVAESANGGLYSNSADFTINSVASGAVDYTFSATGSNNTNNDLIVDTSALNTSGVTSITDSTPFNVYNTSHPESFNGIDDFQLDIRADIDETTPAASDYTDTVTYTVTANF